VHALNAAEEVGREAGVAPKQAGATPAAERGDQRAVVELQHVEQAAVGAMVAVEQRAELGEQPAAAQAVAARAIEPAS
jgi:hypothetical protein